MTEEYQNQRNVEGQNPTVPADEIRNNNLVIRKVTRAIWIAATVLDVMLGFRFILKLFAANPNNLFTQFVYVTTDILVFPFHNLVSNPAIAGGVFEVTTLIAMLVYIFLTWLLIELAILILRR